ncbi:hypothetical protein DFH09DRAFT_470628 [Mycena vulgaris]|nr:hypothetical protein DFH09DRAFT_470628 [Mycena vulgaris]
MERTISFTLLTPILSAGAGDSRARGEPAWENRTGIYRGGIYLPPTHTAWILSMIFPLRHYYFQICTASRAGPLCVVAHQRSDSEGTVASGCHIPTRILTILTQRPAFSTRQVSGEFTTDH